MRWNTKKVFKIFNKLRLINMWHSKFNNNNLLSIKYQKYNLLKIQIYGINKHNQ